MASPNRVRTSPPTDAGEMALQLRPRPARPDPAARFGAPTVVVQPIVSVSTGAVLAVEALSRFPGACSEQVFASATRAGIGPALEATCLRAALRVREQLPPGLLLTVNVSPNALQHVGATELWPDDLSGVVVEITEQEVDTTVDLDEQLAALRRRGAAIAIDDVSSGYAGLLRLAQIRPDYVKIDRQVVRGVGDDPVRAAVLEALVTLSHRLGAAVIGEGVEDLRDLDALAAHDVDYAQGYAIARPATRVREIDAAVAAACRRGRERLLRGAAGQGHAAARTRDVYKVTAALARADERDDLDRAIAAAAVDLGVDVIGVSVVANGLNLREIASTAAALDTRSYGLADYPAALAMLADGRALEVQAGDPGGDAAERLLLDEHDYVSLLLVPVREGEWGRAIGVLEFAQRSTRRWSAHDLAHARGLAALLSPVLSRLGVGTGAEQPGAGAAGGSGVQQRRQREQHDRRPGQVRQGRREDAP